MGCWRGLLAEHTQGNSHVRIKSVHLEDYKRFVDLTIRDIPESVRLVVLIGPNGSGKSSLFDAFLLKSWASRNNYSITGSDQYSGYYNRGPAGVQTTAEVAEGISIEFHCRAPSAPNDWAAAFNIRSAYRNEADFRLHSIQAVQSPQDVTRFSRIIDADQSVSDNYQRLVWKRQADIDRDAPEEMSIGKYRREFLSDLQTAMRTLFRNPRLVLQDFGGVQDAGAFRFSKGTADDFHYKNLSGGEKAAFDLLLDIFVKSTVYKDAIYCIDEPEAHIATALHGPLLKSMLELVPQKSQLWIATHSARFARQAYELMNQDESVVFLDFANRDFDKCVVMTPRVPNRSFWQTTYKVALDDLADLVAPENVVICEGSKSQADRGFDADCYNRIFADRRPDTMFISFGSSSEVENSQHLAGLIGAIAKGVTVWWVIDRDEMNPEERIERIQTGVRVLRRRELENYLYDPEVLRTFLKRIDKAELTDAVLNKRQDLLDHSQMPDDVKSVTCELFEYIRGVAELPQLGRRREGFALSYLVPALHETPSVFQELLEDVFPKDQLTR